VKGKRERNLIRQLLLVLNGDQGPRLKHRILHLQAFLFLMHFFNRDLQTGGEVPEVTLGGLLGGQALAEQLALPVHLADDQEGYDEAGKEADSDTEAKE
jgi:hypothetical protein